MKRQPITNFRFLRRKIEQWREEQQYSITVRVLEPEREKLKIMWREFLIFNLCRNGNIDRQREVSSLDWYRGNFRMSGFGSRLDGGATRTPQMQYLSVYDHRASMRNRRFQKCSYRPLTLKPVSEQCSSWSCRIFPECSVVCTHVCWFKV